MTVEEKIKKFSRKATLLSDEEILRRKKYLRNFRAISALEGFATSALDQEIFDLLVCNKISANDYLSLCQEVTHAKTNHKN